MRVFSKSRVIIKGRVYLLAEAEVFAEGRVIAEGDGCGWSLEPYGKTMIMKWLEIMQIIPDMLAQCRGDTSPVFDVSPAFTRHWINISCLIGSIHNIIYDNIFW